MNIRLRPRLIVLSLLSSLLPLLLTGWVAARWLGEAANEAARTRASTILEVKKNRLEQHFSRYRADMDTLVQGTQALYTQPLQRVEAVRDMYSQAVQRQFQEWLHETETFAATEQLAKQLAGIDWVFRDGGEKITGDRWPVLAATITPALNRLREKQGFDNLYLVSAQGNVVLSAVPDPLLGKNALKAPYKESGLGRLLPAALTKSTLQGFAPVPYLDNAMIAWLGTPIHRDGNPDGKVIGLLAARFAPASLNRLAPNPAEADRQVSLHLVGPDRVRHGGSGPQAPRATGTGPLKVEEVTAPAVLAALANRKGVGTIQGMNGQSVFSAWAPLTIAPSATSQDAPWAVVAEQTVVQAFADARQGTPFYKKLMDQTGYYDFFLIQPDGEVFFSATRQADFGTNLINGKYADTNLGKLVRQVLAKPAFGLTDFEPYPPSHNEPAAFMAQPVLQDGVVKVVVAVQLPLETLTTLMQYRDGLESDGDAYLVGPDQRLRSDSIRDPQNHSVLASFAGKVTGHDLRSEAIQAALAGKTGLTAGKNWSGQPVFTAFAPLSTGHDTTWAVITETPMVQGIIPLQTVPVAVWLVATGTLLGCLGMAWMAATSLRRALFRCIEPLHSMQEGTLSPSPLAARTDELGMVAREIQVIAERWHQVAGRLRDSGRQVVQMGTELTGLMRHALLAHPQGGSRIDLEAGETATREVAMRIQQHLKQIQVLEQLLGRINNTILQGRNTMEQAMTTAREVADKAAQYADTAQQVNQLSMKAAFEVAATGDGKGAKRSGTIVLEIRRLAERGRIFADEIGELSLGMTYMVENAHAIVGSVTATLQESAALVQGMALADAAQHGQMVQIHGMTQELKGRIQTHTGLLQQLTPVAQALARQVGQLEQDLAFFNRGRLTADQLQASDEALLAREELAAEGEKWEGGQIDK
ncbi:MAG: methyl-accepting chemotaxis protein [Magnetococcus sp. DMHC-8]